MTEHVHLWERPDTDWKMEILPYRHYRVNCSCGETALLKGDKIMGKPGFIPEEHSLKRQMQKHDVGCLVNHYGSCPGYSTPLEPVTHNGEPVGVGKWAEENKNMNEFIYLDASRIVLTEETYDSYDEDTGLAMPSYRIWTATIEASLHDDSVGFKNYGPRVEMRRTGDTAAEAYRRLVEALEEQGWTVR